MTYKILIGADPELFVKNRLTGQFRSGHDLIPGTKEDPYIVDGGAVQVDGVALEFNTYPASSRGEFELNILKVRSRMTVMAQEALGSNNFEIVAEPTAYFEKEYFDALPEDPKRLGCTPDYNAYTGEANNPPGTDQPFRTGSGHVHIGFTEYADIFSDDHFDLCRALVKQLDSVLYPLSYMWDTDEKRRELYGKKGAFRPKSYGVEYRVLSNAWLNGHEGLVYDVAYSAADLLLNKGIKLYEL